MLTLTQGEKMTGLPDAEDYWADAVATVRGYVWSVIPHEQDAEDVLQHVAHAVVAKFAQFDATKSFTGWAMGFAKLEILRYRRAHQQRRMIFQSETIEALAEACERHQAETDEVRLHLDDCLGRLSPKLKEVVRMHYLEGMSPREISRVLNTSENAVWVSLHRARVSLRGCVERRIRGRGMGE